MDWVVVAGMNLIVVVPVLDKLEEGCCEHYY